MTRRKDWLNGTPGKKQACRLYWPENDNLGMYIIFETESKKILSAKTYRRDGTESAVGLLLQGSEVVLDDALKIWETKLLLPDLPAPNDWTTGYVGAPMYPYIMSTGNGTDPYVRITGDTMMRTVTISGASHSIYNEYSMPYRAPGIYPIISGSSSFSTSTIVYGTTNYRVEYEDYREDDQEEELDK